ncbi:MAG: helix-turn-helix transcriptional regulator [Candidatus Omnitrophica bacterium]|nr:helix-turn-helix transcriptional regulator [Candidatus Omnitrophota bacterium]MBU1133829.1 helix-turn-helix transcriptional regulator [Candidatus Omnitrophota bacterium]MBU1810892.1 helix-turn-helix transcriptional regulator [Candidatus Omnitrophota bacterium]
MFHQQICPQDLRKNTGKGLSQEELAEKANIHPTYIEVIERGEQAPTLDTIEKIAKALDIKVKELFAFSADKNNIAEEQIITSLAGKDSKALQKILNVIKAMED